jgi:serine/threonine protein kinase
MTETIKSQVDIGDVVADKYRVDRVLGQGGMGIVVSAVHEQLDQRVALKFLLPAVVTNKDIVQRFLREARAAVKIHSEHVARVFDVGTYGVLPYMVMEYLEGSDVAEVIVARGPLPVRDAVGYVLEACDAVAEAHSLGIVHRDLKPANLYLANRPSGKPTIKVLDFGISKAPVTEKDRAITNDTAIMGSPSYMSPEQLVASASVDVRSDIWSLGVVLYEMLTGRLPFNAASMPELVGVILQGNFAAVSTLRTEIPIGLQAVIARCLQKERDQRFQNVGEFARALLPFASSRQEALVERIESVLGLGPPPSSASRAPPGTTSALAIESRTLSPTTTGFSRKKQPLWILAPIGLAVAGIAAFLVVTKMHKEPQKPEPTTGNVVVNATVSAPAVASIAPDPVATTAAPVDTVVAPIVTQSHITGGRPHPSASAAATATVSATATATATASSPACKTVAYFDSAGIKHFKLECH